MRNLYTHNRNRLIYNSIIKNDINGIIFADENGKIILYNPAAEKITGVPAQQLQRRRSEVLFPWADLKSFINSGEEQNKRSIDLNGLRVELTLIKVSVNSNVLGVLMLLSYAPVLPSLPSVETGNTAVNQSVPPHSFSQLTAFSVKASHAIEEAKVYSARREPCVIVGEAGTGKATFANAMHIYSSRGAFPLHHINCATISPRYAAQYFWGRESASLQRAEQGIAERCNHGTILLERVADTDPIVQDCLVRIIKTQQLQRLNGLNSIALDVRLITLVSPQELGALQSRLIPELYYALTPLILRLPPLRERPEDIFPLFEDFVNDSLTLKSNTFSASKTLLTILREYSWPGNLSELKNVACRFSLQVEKLGRLSPYMQQQTLILSIGEDVLFYDLVRPFGNLNNLKSNPEKLIKLHEKLKRILFYSNNRIADRLNISRTTLWRLLNDA